MQLYSVGKLRGAKLMYYLMLDEYIMTESMLMSDIIYWWGSESVLAAHGFKLVKSNA